MAEDNGTEVRKVQHVDIVLKKDVQSHDAKTGFDSIRFLHYALPELDLSKIVVSTKFLSKKLSAPLLITGMTGGAVEVEKINQDLALACEENNIAMGVGSQRAMLEKPQLSPTYSVRKQAPSIFLLSNIGVYQLKKYSIKQVQAMVDATQADALAVHLNPLQEAVQPEGDKDFTGCLDAIRKLCDELSVPVVAKEVGAGINGEVANELVDAGVKAIDVSGVGGTSWSAIEGFRKGAQSGEEFREWGLPTLDALRQCAGAVEVPLIASGGVRNGIDVAKSIRFGATLGGAAFPFIKAQNEGGAQAVSKLIAKWVNEIRICCFLTRSKNLEELAQAKLLE
ncbi:type 2 isopentenyl-diphosphate Delta-isomerase [Candidatus Micrarchaeota archaeon]|nr:type 2 isopentenyl-diphosphate Delta-isomerase [Candidatus Micrarchaeota archaeon]